MLVYGLPLLVLGGVLITSALVVFQAKPRWMGSFIYTAPLFMLVVAPLFWLLIRAWRQALRGADAVLTHPPAPVVNLIPAEELETAQQTPLLLNTQTVEALTPLTEDAQPGTPFSTQPSAPRFIHEAEPKPASQPESHSTMSEPTQTLTIDGTEYNLADLSTAAQQQLTNLRLCDQEIQRLQQQLAIAQTARGAYAQALQGELPKAEH